MSMGPKVCWSGPLETDPGPAGSLTRFPRQILRSVPVCRTCRHSNRFGPKCEKASGISVKMRQDNIHGVHLTNSSVAEPFHQLPRPFSWITGLVLLSHCCIAPCRLVASLPENIPQLKPLFFPAGKLTYFFILRS